MNNAISNGKVLIPKKQEEIEVPTILDQPAHASGISPSALGEKLDDLKEEGIVHRQSVRRWVDKIWRQATRYERKVDIVEHIVAVSTHQVSQ